MIKLFISVAIIFTLLIGWILVQQVARYFAAKHPEFGAIKEEGLGCGKTCGCKKGSCYQEQEEE